MNRISILILVLLFPFMGKAQINEVSANLRLHDHPRLFLYDEDLENVRNSVNSNTLVAEVHRQLISKANMILEQSTNKKRMEGRRMLAVSTDNLNRIFILSYAYRMTEDSRYSDRAREEMLEAASFDDWNPSHILDTGEMTLALVIGYDWLYNKLSADDRRTIARAITSKGLDPSENDAYNRSFIQQDHNINQVCNASFGIAAIALWENDKRRAARILSRSIQHVRMPMRNYAPDGAYAEGPGYWEYGTSFNVAFIAALEKALSTDYGLSETPGFLASARFYACMITPSGNTFNYGDGGSPPLLPPSLIWFHGKTHDSSLLAHALSLYPQHGTTIRRQWRNGRFAPLIPVWAAGMDNMEKPAEELSSLDCFRGDQSVCVMRSSRTDPDGAYVGVKLGTPSYAHAHMDVGSFIYEYQGVRWALDPGSETYNTFEQRGIDFWNYRQDSPRWRIYRHDNLHHNTLSFGQQLQIVSGKVLIGDTTDSPLRKTVAADLTPVYAGQVKSLRRTVSLEDGKFCRVVDEIHTDGSTVLSWNMMTAATVERISDTTLKLSSGQRQLFLKASGIRGASWTFSEAKPYQAYERPNPGITELHLTAALQPQTAYTLTVAFADEP